MTASTATTVAEPTLDLSGTRPVPFGRLVRVELRKMYDTRAGFWLLLVTGLLLVLAAVVTLLVTVLNEVSITAGTLSQIMVIPLSLLLPVFAITTVTSEWSQRTALTTFALESHRMRVLLAKLVTVVGLALATIVAAVVIGALTNLLHGTLSGTAADWTVEGSALAWTVVNQLLYFLMAFGVATCLLSTPAAVAIYYVIALLLPFMVYGPVFAIFSWGQDVIPWIDLGFAMTPLVEGREATGTTYAQVLVTTAVWVVLPLVLGQARVRGTELK
jgi:ABC-type transport system involved in multi-copper enzyme maturation permease subunit